MQDNEKADFRVGVIGEMEYPQGQFDVIISMDSLYFAKDMSQFVGQVYSWLKEDGLFLIGYQEGDVMPKTENSETAVIARALRENHFQYQVTDMTEDTYRMLQRKRESILKYKEAFRNEGLNEWYEMVLGQTECATVSPDEYRRQNARYLFVAKKEK